MAGNSPGEGSEAGEGRHRTHEGFLLRMLLRTHLPPPDTTGLLVFAKKRGRRGRPQRRIGCELPRGRRGPRSCAICTQGHCFTQTPRGRLLRARSVLGATRGPHVARERTAGSPAPGTGRLSPRTRLSSVSCPQLPPGGRRAIPPSPRFRVPLNHTAPHASGSYTDRPGRHPSLDETQRRSVSPQTRRLASGKRVLGVMNLPALPSARPSRRVQTGDAAGGSARP